MVLSIKGNIQREYRRILGEFKQLWKNYLYQSLIAVAVLVVVLLTLSMQQAVIIASIGATSFIVFTMPDNVTAGPRRVIGGHLTGFVCGCLAALIPHETVFLYIVVCAVAVGVSIFLMVVLDFEHPPASGTALGLAMTGFSISAMIAIITSSVVLSLAHVMLRKYLKNLI